MFGWIKKVFGHSNTKSKSLYQQNLEKRNTTKPINFGNKWIWAAIKTENTDNLLADLKLKKQRLVNWVEGTLHAYRGDIFVLPPIEGWIIISGWGLPTPDHEEGIESAKKLLNDLSQKYGEAQLFGNHSVSLSAFWMKSTNGNTERLYCVSDCKTIIEGEPTKVEMKWDLIDTNSKEANSDAYWDKMLYPDAEHVLEVAKDWSLNPMELEEKENVGEYGHIGSLK